VIIVPDLIIIAGPNGAGKTTFAREYLSGGELRFEFVNADEIARLLAIETSGQVRSDIRAGRMMLDRIDELTGVGADLAIETTLATLIYANKILNWRRVGYNVSLVYLRLSSVTEALARVRRRVEAGGHDIPPEVIERRFQKSADYFETIYKPIVDDWHLWESREGQFIRVASSDSP
jgi:predicted ABC-type ATPase